MMMAKRNQDRWKIEIAIDNKWATVADGLNSEEYECYIAEYRRVFPGDVFRATKK